MQLTKDNELFELLKIIFVLTVIAKEARLKPVRLVIQAGKLYKRNHNVHFTNIYSLIAILASHSCTANHYAAGPIHHFTGLIGLVLFPDPLLLEKLAGHPRLQTTNHKPYTSN